MTEGKPYVYQLPFDIVPSAWPLSQIQTQRPREFELFQDLFCQLGDDEFQRILEHIGSSPEFKFKAKRAHDLIQECCMRKVSFVQVFIWVMEGLDTQDHILIWTLEAFHSPFVPLKFTQNYEVDYTIEVDLGQEVNLVVQAEGVPRPIYHWFTMDQGDSDWRNHSDRAEVKFTYIEVVPMKMFICQARHCIQVRAQDGEQITGIYSNRVSVKLREGSIHFKSSPTSGPHTIGSCVTLSVSVLSDRDLAFQWFHKDEPIAGATETELIIQEFTLDDIGEYFCLAQNDMNKQESSKAVLNYLVPPEDQLDSIEFSNEHAVIVQQPTFKADEKCSVGDRISMRCVAVCKFRLQYEWIKQGMNKDLVDGPNEPVAITTIQPVCHGMQLGDEIPDMENTVTYWQYKCIITCIETGERIESDPVICLMSTYASMSKTWATFKIALVICQEEYWSDDFHDLSAPRLDGKALAKALKEMDFQVLAFINLTLQEVRDVLELFCTFIDESTYALFYYNGHALGHGEENYLVAKDSKLNPDIPLSDQLIWHGEIELRMNECQPLLGLVIYDSCRDIPPESIMPLLSQSNPGMVTFSTSFLVAYGTKAGMKSFEYASSSVCQGLYMKHLLKHIRSTQSIGSVFESVTDSFTREEDPSIAASQMTPEFKNATKQILCLNSPFRTRKFTMRYHLFFQMCRYEALYGNFKEQASNEFSCDLAVKSDGQGGWNWITGGNQESTTEQYDGYFKVTVGPSDFYNEARIGAHFRHLKPDEPLPSIRFQVLPINCSLVHQGNYFQPCRMNERFQTESGPMFTPQEGSIPMGECQAVDLQSLGDLLKLKVALYSQEQQNVCRGILKIATPMLKHFPKFRINNLAYRGVLS